MFSRVFKRKLWLKFGSRPLFKHYGQTIGYVYWGIFLMVFVNSYFFN
jgi:hypothetical protein